MQLPLRLSEPGPLLSYIMWLYTVDKKKALDVADMAARALRTPEGRILLELIEKSVEATPTKILEDPRALVARNAQAFIASDLKRILSDETKRLHDEREADSASVARRHARRGSGHATG